MSTLSDLVHEHGDADETDIEWLHLLLGWLQDALGYLGPLLVLCAVGIGLALMLLRLLRGQVAR